MTTIAMLKCKSLELAVYVAPFFLGEIFVLNKDFPSLDFKEGTEFLVADIISLNQRWIPVLLEKSNQLPHDIPLYSLRVELTNTNHSLQRSIVLASYGELEFLEAQKHRKIISLTDVVEGKSYVKNLGKIRVLLGEVCNIYEQCKKAGIIND